MASVHKGYRLDVTLVSRIDEWAEAHNMSHTDAVRALLASALDTYDDEREREEYKQTTNFELRGNVEDLRRSVETLTAQLEVKDEQIRRLAEIAEHSQLLTAAHIAKGLPEATTGPERPSGGFWEWLRLKIAGR